MRPALVELASWAKFVMGNAQPVVVPTSPPLLRVVVATSEPLVEVAVVVGTENRCTTTGPFCPAAPQWMCAAVTRSLLLTLRLNFMLAPPSSNDTRAVPVVTVEVEVIGGTSLAPLRLAVKVNMLAEAGKVKSIRSARLAARSAGAQYR